MFRNQNRALNSQDRTGGTLDYLDPDGTVNYSYVPWDTLNSWLTSLNGFPHSEIELLSGVNRGKVIDELESRRSKSSGVVAFGARMVGRNLGYGADWREYENDHGYTHLEELLVYQPAEWRKQAREYMFVYKFDLERVSHSETRLVTVSFGSAVVPETTLPVRLSSPVLVVVFHLDMQRSRRYEPLNFLLAYGVKNPLPQLLDTIGNDGHQKDFLEDVSPLDYFFHFQEAVQTYKLDLLQSIGTESKFPRLGLIKELDFSDIVGQRLAKQIIREEVVQHVWNRGPNDGMLKAQQPLSMIFAGPSGNGKTELAKQLATIMNKPEDNCFIKVDCGKLSRMEEVFGLSGAYQGASEGSALNNFVIQMSEKKESLGIVLLDEIEKAKQCVIHGLYQVIDKGEWTNKKLSEGKGVQTETISCHNIIFIMTTNAADRCICDAARSGGAAIVGRENHPAKASEHVPVHGRVYGPRRSNRTLLPHGEVEFE
jgi:energy-coupling factor transporter ATP-binding protein EcfA2